MNIAFIPVRAGSKSIPLKNIRLLCGKPLVYWTAKAANNASCIDKVIIATDSAEIRKVVRSFNLPKVEIYDRDPANAQDTSSTESVMLEYLEKAGLDNDDLFFLIQATSPLLSTKHIKEMYNKYINSDYDSMFTGVREKQFHWIETENGIEPINYDYKNRPRRQDFQGIIAENGACYINKVGNILRDKCRLSGKIGTFELPPETAYEIDEENDFLVLENIMRKNDRNRLNIALCATNDWLEYSSVTVASILTNADPRDEYHFYIVSDQFSDKEKNLFYRLDKIKRAEYHFLTVNNDDFDGCSRDWLGVSALYRLKLPSLVDEDKILYLDSDITVMQNIFELYNHNIDDYYVAAVEDKCSKNRGIGFNFEDNEKYFNSGVVLMNLKAMRENNLEEAFLENLKNGKCYTDQDALNYVCMKKTLQLPLKYNIMLPLSIVAREKVYEDRYEEALEAEKDPVLIHHIAKPWNCRTLGYNMTWARLQRLINSYK